MKFFKKYQLLIYIILLGLFLRVLNPTFGFPSLFVSNDEAIYHLSALNMIENRTILNISYYTPLGSYLQIPFLILSFVFLTLSGVVESVAEMKFLLLSEKSFLLLVPRLISGFFGTFSIVIFYLITLELTGNRKQALLAAFLGAVSFSLVHMAHFGRPWTAFAFFFLLTVYLMLKKRLFLATSSAIVSYGFLQTGIFSFLIILLLARKLRSLLIPLGISAVFVYILNKLTLFSSLEDTLQKFRQGIIITDFFTSNFNFFESFKRTLFSNSLIYQIKNGLFVETIIFIFSVLGLFKMVEREKRILFFAIIYAIFAILFLYPTFHYLLPSVLLLIHFSAKGVYRFVEMSKIRVIKFSIISLIFFIGLIHSVYWNWLFLQKPTFIQAKDWIDQNVRRDISIAYLGGRYQTFSPSQEPIINKQAEQKGYEASLLNFLNNNFDNPNVRDIYYLSAGDASEKLTKVEELRKSVEPIYIVDYFYDRRNSLLLANREKFILVAEFSPIKKSCSSQLNVAETLYQASWNFKTADPYIEADMYCLTGTGPIFHILALTNIK